MDKSFIFAITNKKNLDLNKKNNKKYMIWSLDSSYGKIIFVLLAKVITFYVHLIFI